MSMNKAICVKFQLDNPKHLAAWQFLKEKGASKITYAEAIAELVEQSRDSLAIPTTSNKQMEQMLVDVKSLCEQIKNDLSKGILPLQTTCMSESVNLEEEEQQQAEIPGGIASLLLGMGDDD